MERDGAPLSVPPLRVIFVLVFADLRFVLYYWGPIICLLGASNVFCVLIF
ncbi:hypothetical protein RchiOBHm_Chr1g0353781 [Rosa chinensis]|uniref:Uncharacterized protein n=1 Tax=Rosa chinensis TaxID=74649 RepID=A0A2P6SGX5_ROSCH|nr:hypothetical protein RchiOBHm_Chr1g0353781 [Rosa chinensis]